MMQTLKRTHPELSKLVSKLIYGRHQVEAQREVAEIRDVLGELIRRSRKPEDLMHCILTGEPIGGAVVKP